VEFTRAQVQQYAAELIADNKEANIVRLRQASLRAFAGWLVTEGELSADPLEGLKPPKLPTKVVEALTDDQLRALLKACQGAVEGSPRRGHRAVDGRDRAGCGQAARSQV
jgi:integrase/recombinase XerD